MSDVEQAKKLFFDALALIESSDFESAELRLRDALRHLPGNASILTNLAVVLQRRDKIAEAQDCAEKVVASQADNIEALLVLADCYVRGEKSKDALAVYDKIISLNPEIVEAYNNRGIILQTIGQFDAALDSCDRAIALAPDSADTHINRGNVLRNLMRYDEALLAYERALSKNQNGAKAWFGRGNVFHDLRRFEEAIAAFDHALALNPGLADAWLGRGNVLYDLKRYDSASVAYSKALALESGKAEAWLGRGNVWYDLKRYDDAIAAYDKALALKPDFVEAWIGRASVFNKRRSYSEAFVAYDKAFVLKPDLRGLEGDRLYAKLHVCDWRDYDAECAHLISSVKDGKLFSHPSALLPISSSGSEQLCGAESWSASKAPLALPAMPRSGRYSHDRIRVAFVSSDLREHPVGQQMSEVFERHDKSRFELIAMSTQVSPESEIGSRIKNALEHFVDATAMDDAQIADYIRRREIDIAVDLNGFTDGGRQGVFALRPAPTQVNYLGYAGTLGADCYDYIVADRTVIPESSFGFYREKVVWLPGSFMPTESRRPVSKRVLTRAEQNLPDDGFVFCCFNAPYKLTPEVFAVWMQLLKAVEGSVLWLSGPNDAAKANLRREAEQAGVAPDRLIFAARIESRADHMARHRLADLFLDTRPYNAHVTAVDALWAGVPLVTCLGETFAGRVAASLLNAAGLPELVTQSLDDYEALALRLAGEPALLASIKSKLVSTRDTCPLFDTSSFTRHIEAAYSQMWERHQRGEAPAAFSVEASSRVI